MAASFTPCAVALDQVSSLGTGLRRPECVLATESGDLFVTHLGSGVMHIAPDGRQRTIGAVAEIDGKPWIPNGIALTQAGDFIIANMGEGGGLWRLKGDGSVEPFLRAVDGVTLTATNFVTADRSGRLWVTVTTRQWPISKAMAPKGPNQPADGYLFVVDEAGARIVADGFAFANEVRLNADESEAYVVETFGRRITRFKVGEKASLSRREIFTEFGHGVFADGAAFDAEGCLWVASIISNRILRVAPDGSQSLVLEDCNVSHVDRIERLIAAGEVARDDMQRSPTAVLKNVASVTFAGPDLRNVYLGSLGGDRLAVLRSPVAGLPPVHWKYRARI
jgi:sugar lactone lactonase YvrE